jgi:hypothetical protein
VQDVDHLGDWIIWVGGYQRVLRVLRGYWERERDVAAGRGGRKMKGERKRRIDL